jgi:hypothetical protein
MLTKEIISQNMPANKRGMVTDDVVNRFNESISGTDEEKEMLRDNFISYMDVLASGNVGIEHYLNAVKYVSYKLTGANNQQAWSKTFPDRYIRLMGDPYLSTQVASYVTAYNKSKLVNQILAQSMVPTYVLNQDIHQKAVNHLAYLMANAKSEKVQADSAAAVLTHLKVPEAQKVDFTVKMEQQDGLNTLNATLVKLAEQQQQLIASGVGTKEIAHQRLEIQDAEFSEVKNE